VLSKKAFIVCVIIVSGLNVNQVNAQERVVKAKLRFYLGAVYMDPILRYDYSIPSVSIQKKGSLWMHEYSLFLNYERSSDYRGQTTELSHNFQYELSRYFIHKEDARILFRGGAGIFVNHDFKKTEYDVSYYYDTKIGNYCVSVKPIIYSEINLTKRLSLEAGLVVQGMIGCYQTVFRDDPILTKKQKRISTIIYDIDFSHQLMLGIAYKLN